jgi:carbamoyltransferase
MKILGISSYYHDAAITITENGIILFAAQEERYTRKKNDDSFPVNAIKKGLEHCNLCLTDFDAIVYYEKPLLKFERILQSYLDTAPFGFTSFLQAMHVWTKEKLFIKQQIARALNSIHPAFKKQKIKLLFTEHHLSHAASAFYPSPFESACILTTDGVGEYATTTLSFGNGKNIEMLREIHFPHSIGLLYSAITYFLGFKVNSDEYKVMGLAAYGNAADTETERYISIIEQELINIQPDGSYTLHMKNFAFTRVLTMVDDACWEKLFGIKKRHSQEELTQEHCNIAYAFQKVTEKVVLLLCKEIKKLKGSDNICLAGGVALNCVINGILKDSGIFKNIFIQPAGGDAGGALGAALATHYIYFGMERIVQQPDAMQNSLLGDSFTDEEILDIIKQHSGVYSCSDDDEVCKKTARLIAEGKAIGWFQGRMEFGPRALGNRSIIADARSEAMQLYLNLKIKNRESFRPFAPAVLEEDADKYFEISGTSPYMLQVHQLKKELLKSIPDTYRQFSIKEKLYLTKSIIPAVTHVDFTARIQSVNKKQHPKFYKLIDAFKQLTGCSLVINTSFNVKDEPIVCTPKDAYDCFMKTGLDVLVLNNYIIYKESEQPVSNI